MFNYYFVGNNKKNIICCCTGKVGKYFVEVRGDDDPRKISLEIIIIIITRTGLL